MNAGCVALGQNKLNQDNMFQLEVEAEGLWEDGGDLGGAGRQRSRGRKSGRLRRRGKSFASGDNLASFYASFNASVVEYQFF